MSAAMAMVSWARRGMSQIATSTVSKKGCGRTSHQIFLALSMQLVLMRRFTYSRTRSSWRSVGEVGAGEVFEDLGAVALVAGVDA